MNGITTDFRYAVRNLRRRPGFYLAIVVTLALGIGANTGIFTLLSALLLHPVPYEDPDRLVHVWQTVQRESLERREFSYPDFVDFRDRATSFEELAAYDDHEVSLTAGGARRLCTEIVTPSYFDVLGVEPLLGRGFSEDPGAAASEVILGYDLWQRIFAGEPEVLGRTLDVDGAERVLVAVMPQGFRGLESGIELWTPMASAPQRTLEQRRNRWHRVVGRLRDGVALERADGETAQIFAQLRDEAGADQSYGATVVALVEDLFGNLRQPLSLLLGAAAFVLLIACSNVANLLLIRAAGRRRESALRKALGASRGRMARQNLVETLLITLAGGALALLVASWGVDLLAALNPIPLPDFVTFELDLPVLLFNFAAVLATALTLSLIETWQARNLKLAAQLREGDRLGGGREGRRGRRILVVTEMAFAMVLLIGAGLMARSLSLMRQVETGFDARDLLFFRVDLPPDRYGEEQARAFSARLLEDLRHLAGVENVGLGRNTPLDGDASGIVIRIEGQDVPEDSRYDGIRVHRQSVAPGYFKTLGIELLSGRDFGPQDTAEGPPTVILSESLARRFEATADGEASPIGRRLWRGRELFTVVGVVRDVRHRNLIRSAGTPEDPDLYFSMNARAPTNFAVVLRSQLPTEALLGPVRERLGRLEAGAVLYDVRTIDERITHQVARPRFSTALIALFAALALALAALGLAGTLGYDVAARQREIGIRMALGAKASGILRMVARESLGLIAAGTACGLVLALALGRLLKSQLYHVSVTDLTAFAGMTLLLVGVAIVASLIPARRAAAVDPLVSLRHE